MAVLKCKMCGGTLEVNEGQTVVQCEYCGVKQTVPSLDNEKKLALFKRADEYRYKCEFDKAANVYEDIVHEFPEEAEAYWGLILCKYGIEYVGDPKTSSRIPTCHRTQFGSIFDDADYKNVIKYADVIARDVYEKEAEGINKLQKAILKISSKEKPFDIFICFKDTFDDTKKRTPESVLAENIYNLLCKEGYRVFFSRVTLKPGDEFEPRIFAALHSSKLMIHVTTDLKRSEAIWVQNEWSRYLALLKHDDSKHFFFCFRDIDPSKLHPDIAGFNSINCSDVGWELDVVNSARQYLDFKTREELNASEKEVRFSDEKEMFEGHIRKGYVYLSKEMFNDAKETFENAIKLVEKCGRAYIGLMLAEAEEKDFDSFLDDYGFDCSELEALDLAESLADDKCLKELDEIRAKIKRARLDDCVDRLDELVKEEEWSLAKSFIEVNSEFKDELEEVLKEALYEYACNFVDGDFDKSQMSNYQKACQLIDLLDELGDYKDSSDKKLKAEQIKKDIIDEYIKRYCSMLTLPFVNPAKTYSESCLIAKSLLKIKGLYSKEKYGFDEIKIFFEGEYDRVLALLRDGSKSVVDSFTTMNDCKEYKKVISSVAESEYFKEAYDCLKAKEDEIQAKLDQEAKKAKKIKTIVILSIVGAICLSIVGTIIGVVVSNNKKKRASYNSAIALMERGKFDDANVIFKSLDKFDDSKNKAYVCSILYKFSGFIGSGYSINDFYDISNMMFNGVSVMVDYYDSTEKYIVEENGSHTHRELYPAQPFTTQTPNLYDPNVPGYHVDKYKVMEVSYSHSNETAYLKFKTVFAITTYKINYENLGTATNSSFNPRTYKMGESYTLLNPGTREGYTFKEWQLNNEPITEITPTMYGDLAINAVWTPHLNVFTLNNGDSTCGSVQLVKGTGYSGEEMIVRATANPGYIFKGWYDSAGHRVSLNPEYSFEMATKNYELTGQFYLKEETNNYAVPVFNTDKQVIEYGSYPQSLVTDSSLLSELNNSAVLVSGKTYTYNSIRYEKVIATPYSDKNNVFLNGENVVSGKTYWFKYEPIEWNFLQYQENHIELFAIKTLDAHVYNSYSSSSYNRSNSYFGSLLYNYFENELETRAFFAGKSNLYMTIKNVEAAPSKGSYSYTNITSYVYPPSFYDFDFNGSYQIKKSPATDYAIAKGCPTNHNFKYDVENQFYSSYWTRSPFVYDSSDVEMVSVNGAFFNVGVGDTNGIRPCITIS